jgi:hypothetical protein
MNWDYGPLQFKIPAVRSKPIPFDGPPSPLSGFVVFAVIYESPRQSKVTNLGLVSGCKEDVPSGQVKVNKSLLFQVLHACVNKIRT